MNFMFISRSHYTFFSFFFSSAKGFWGLDINVRKTKVMIFSRGEDQKNAEIQF